MGGTDIQHVEAELRCIDGKEAVGRWVVGGDFCACAAGPRRVPADGCQGNAFNVFCASTVCCYCQDCAEKHRPQGFTFFHCVPPSDELASLAYTKIDHDGQCQFWQQ